MDDDKKNAGRSTAPRAHPVGSILVEPQDGSPPTVLRSWKEVPLEVRERLVAIRVERKGEVIWEPGMSEEESLRREREAMLRDGVRIFS